MEVGRLPDARELAGEFDRILRENFPERSLRSCMRELYAASPLMRAVLDSSRLVELEREENTMSAPTDRVLQLLQIVTMLKDSYPHLKALHDDAMRELTSLVADITAEEEALRQASLAPTPTLPPPEPELVDAEPQRPARQR